MRALLIAVVRFAPLRSVNAPAMPDHEHERRDQQLDEGVAALVRQLGRRISMLG